MSTSAIWEAIYVGLAARGFGPLNGQECSKGGCHTADGKHFVLLTDGMVIYSNVRDWNDDRPGVVSRQWYGDEFDFAQLDAIMEKR